MIIINHPNGLNSDRDYVLFRNHNQGKDLGFLVVGRGGRYHAVALPVKGWGGFYR